MKRFVLLIIAVMFLFTGCAGLQLTDAQSFALKKAARLAGIYLALEQPGDVDKALSYCEYIDSLENGKLKETALKAAFKYIKDQYGAGLKATIFISEVADIITYAIPDDTGLEFDTKLLDMAVKSFKEGLALAVK